MDLKVDFQFCHIINRMADYPASSQTNGSAIPKTFSPYVQPVKTFQPYTPVSVAINSTPQLNKYSESKSEQIKISKPSISPVSVSRPSPNSNNVISPKVENSQFKPIPAFLQNRNVMKGSMMNIENQNQGKFSKGQQPTSPLSTSQQQINVNVKKVPRNSDNSDMKQSSMELGSEGLKVPAFLNKQKKIPYTADVERPQSSRQYRQVNGIKDVVVPNSLTNSYGNLKRTPTQQKQLRVPEAKDPTTEWAKLSWNKKKQRTLTLDDFEQIKQLGTGKYGKVYLVRDKQTNFIFALKVLQKNLIKSEEITEQQIRQLKIQSFLNHPNIIRMYGFFDDAKNLYLIMEAATGGQLFKQLKKHQSMPETKVASIMRQVCQAVNELHSNRIIHRDIKPQNIVMHDNILKLCDFGWSVYCDSNLRTTFCGTPLYVGPQILKGKQYDQKIDIWSLGVMMYEMLVGQNPFKITKQEQLVKIIKDQIKIPPYIEISQQCRSFLFSCLQKSPQSRLSIRELLNHEFFKKYPEKDKKL